MTSGTEQTSVEAPSKLGVRPAAAEDLDVFVKLAQACATNSGRPLNEDEARWMFAGIARADPAIHLLFDGSEPIGFTIVRIVFTPLTRFSRMQQEIVYVREDKRTKAAEMLLHLMTLEIFKTLPVGSEITLLVSPGRAAPEIIDELQRMGFGEHELRMKAFRLPPKQIESTPEDVSEGPTLH